MTTKLHIVSQTKDVTHEEKIVVEKEAQSTPQVVDNKDERRAELERLAAETEAAFNTLDQKPTASPDDPLAVKKIERLFKEPNVGRSPFAS